MSEQISDVILEASDLHKSFEGNNVIDGVDLRIKTGEVILLCGDNGSGKTTLLNILTGHIEPDSGEVKIWTRKKPLEFLFTKKGGPKLRLCPRFCPEIFSRYHVGRTWQDLRLFSSLTLIDNLNVASPHQLGENPVWSILRRRDVHNQERQITDLSEGTLESLNLLSKHNSSSADMISLGQSKRVSIARAIINEAHILFLDEPLAGLDSKGCSTVTDILNEIVTKRKTSLVIVEHPLNMQHILNIATTVWIIHNGSLTRQSIENFRGEVTDYSPDSIESLFTGGKSENLAQREKQPGNAELSLINVRPPGQPILEIKELKLRRSGQALFGSSQDNSSAISFILHLGQIGILRAPNGWGKTSLMEAIMGFLSISDGEILLDGENLAAEPATKRRKKGLTYIRSNSNVFPNLTVAEHFHLSNEKIPGSLSHLAGREAAKLSGGEQMKVAIESSLSCSNIQIVMLDEPFYSLDEKALLRTVDKLVELAQTGAVLMTLPGKCH
jgi:ABC-type branched-subunit amino acid transport system ATPase component